MQGTFARTSTTSTESPVPVATLCTDANHFSVDVFRVVRVDVSGAATAVGDFGGRHGGIPLMNAG